MARAAARPRARRTLLLDLDGTLAPIAPTPESARVPEEVRRALAKLLRAGWRVAIVSGRPAAQVRRMVGLRGVRIFGSHGLEGSWGRRRRVRVRPSVAGRLRALAREGTALAARFPGARVERKPGAVAFHDRNVPARRLRAWRAALRGLLERSSLEGLEMLRGKRVWEVRAAGVHKGLVVRPLRRRLTAPDPSLVAVGDDRTDEDLFREIGRLGTTVRVGPPRAATAARYRLPSPRAVRVFLETLAALSLRERRRGA